MIFQVLVFFWLVFFVSAISQLVLAGSFASYYWAFNKPDDIPTLPVAKAIGITLRYHVGSAAFGSLIITILKLIQGILEYLNRKFEKEQNKLAAFIVKCLGCCCLCLEKLILYINRNAYILVMVHGSNFCSSAWRAFKLLARNILRVLVLDKITDLLMMVGRLVAILLVALPSGFFFSGYISYFEDYVKTLGLNFYMVPVILIVVGGFIVAREFFSVYSMGVDTIFLSFLEDLERNDGTAEKPYYMSKDLMKILGKKNVKDRNDSNGNADGETGEEAEAEAENQV
ncbi:hypothetical protein CAPTEDRAFT_153507 [Capitella teleta]|uniref:Choline transporter-like protein n=1 Tax=Capitella teleta TaxID=283909 RepID=R7TIX0_CAPTE|nr:hypothetical protein CAPTEDRAFT_153507 [Capitella teleta]|eukprot:ELT91491.1 hypothetical protein CAPTEDRAFT_153507 [Capitella teleta]